jgi:hypothetical protein
VRRWTGLRGGSSGDNSVHEGLRVSTCATGHAALGERQGLRQRQREGSCAVKAGPWHGDRSQIARRCFCPIRVGPRGTLRRVRESCVIKKLCFRQKCFSNFEFYTCFTFLSYNSFVRMSSQNLPSLRLVELFELCVFKTTSKGVSYPFHFKENN